jgi:hypothetical protein
MSAPIPGPNMGAVLSSMGGANSEANPKHFPGVMSIAGKGLEGAAALKEQNMLAGLANTGEGLLGMVSGARGSSIGAKLFDIFESGSEAFKNTMGGNAHSAIGEAAEGMSGGKMSDAPMSQLGGLHPDTTPSVGTSRDQGMGV